ncbi:hypothetical protein O181_017574 [Austropuccinia psidii MF-1]|uniref:Uncharacterized protein n=1 Tax=Austropuccinia psidii MF-1 TaxID=1389203 RepID=A0A9Q3C5Z5_9BASI|nr:hypothetical protein [Austropuccinia psidii MF-1]
MKEGGHVSLYISDFRSLMSRIGDWGERAYIYVYRRGLASRPLDQLASYPGNFDALQELMYITLELDTRYHERHKEKVSHLGKKPPVAGSNPSRPPQNSSSKRPYHKKNKKGKQFQASRDKPHSALLNMDNELIGSEKEMRIKEGLSGKSLSGNNDVFNGSHLLPSRDQLCTLNTSVKKSSKSLIFSSISDIFYSILIDSSATNSSIAKNLVLKYSLTISELPEKIPLLILDSNESPALFITHHTEWAVDLPSFPSVEWDICIINSPKGEDLILGYDFLYHSNPIIYWKNGLITYDSSHKDSSGIKSSSSNALATAVNSFSLVGELKTPSLPSSVHIPSIMPSQSLLEPRDEVSKEINDVGEDVAISSLHFFHGDMNLPPLSFHAFLE